MKTSSGHLSHLDTPSYSFYTPTPFPVLEQRLFPPRDRQTLQHTSSALLVSVVRMGYVLAVVVPVHTVAALVSHTLVSKDRWMDRGWGRGRFPKRLPSWSVGQTLGVPLVGSLFWAVVYGSPRGMDWREESTVPWASKWLFGRGHEGWCIEAEGVTLPALPTERERTAKTSNGEAKHNGGHELSKQHGKTNDDADFIEQAAKATSLSSFTDDSLSIAPPPAPYSINTEGIPLDILRGHVDGKQFNVHPVPVAAFWQWKSVASAVSRGKVISVKPGTTTTPTADEPGRMQSLGHVNDYSSSYLTRQYPLVISDSQFFPTEAIYLQQRIDHVTRTISSVLNGNFDVLSQADRDVLHTPVKNWQNVVRGMQPAHSGAPMPASPLLVEAARQDTILLFRLEAMLQRFAERL